METRKLVRSGNSSYILSLPINWVRNNSLEQGKQVNIQETEQGDLIISVGSQKKKEREIATIKIDGKDAEIIHLELLSAYVNDPDKVIFEGKEIVKKTDEILKIVSFFIGLDIIEQSTEIIVAKNFFSLDKETSPKNLINKMNIINRSIFRLLETFFLKGFSDHDFVELQKLHKQNMRIFNLGRKIICLLLEQPSLMREIKTTPLQSAKQKLYLQHLMNISKSMQMLGKSLIMVDLEAEQMKEFKQLFMSSFKDYQSLIVAIQNRDNNKISEYLQEAYQQTSKIDRLFPHLEDPILIKAINSVSLINVYLKNMAYEALT